MGLPNVTFGDWNFRRYYYVKADELMRRIGHDTDSDTTKKIEKIIREMIREEAEYK